MKPFLFAIPLAVLPSLLLAAASPGAAQPIPVPSGQQTGVSVVGEGIVLAQPNIVRITLGSEVFDPTLANAQAEAARRMEAIIQRMRNAGIPDTDIRTVSYNVNPVYDNQAPNQMVLRGYQVTNLVDVKSSNIGGVGALIDDAVAAGASRVYGIRFEAEDMSGLKAQARDQAMVDARAKAEQLARNAGVALGRPILVQESDASGVPVRADAAPASLRAAPAAAPAPPIQGGELEVRTIVNVVYSIQ